MYNMQDFMKSMKVMLDLCSEHTSAMAKGVGKPYLTLEKREINKVGDRIGSSNRNGINYKGLRDPWQNVKALKCSYVFSKIVTYLLPFSFEENYVTLPNTASFIF